MKTAAGIYIHIPFCLAKCPYCDFYSKTDLSQIPQFIDALEKEIRNRSSRPVPVDSIYFGGGTPSVLKAPQIARILEEIRLGFDLFQDTEITLEVNPGTVSCRSLSDFHDIGINRLNIGVQSFSDHRLRLLGRIHDADTAIRAVGDARRAGFDNLGLDLIYGTPGHTEKEWKTDLDQAVSFSPEHLSCYMLTIEEGTPMATQIQCGELEVLPEDSMAGLFKTTVQTLERSGYKQYEISNFAREAHKSPHQYQSRHNTKYWNFIPYWGFGPGAHSYTGVERIWNHRSLSAYLTDLKQDRLPVSGKEWLNREQQIMEALYLGFRQTKGIGMKTFEKRFGISFTTLFQPVITHLQTENLLEMREGRCALTPNGQLLLDAICGMFAGQDLSGII